MRRQIRSGKHPQPLADSQKECQLRWNKSIRKYKGSQLLEGCVGGSWYPNAHLAGVRIHSAGMAKEKEIQATELHTSRLRCALWSPRRISPGLFGGGRKIPCDLLSLHIHA